MPTWVAALASVLLAGACASSGGAPPGAVTNCGTVQLGGRARGEAVLSPQLAGQCYVRALRSCHAARLVLQFRGVDSGSVEVLTVRRGGHRSCVTAVAQESSVLGRTTHRHLTCRTASVGAEGVQLADCTRPL